jgi:hypothetical protein
MKVPLSAMVLGVALCATAHAQDANPSPSATQNSSPGPGAGQGRGAGRGAWGNGMGGGRGVMGTVTEVNADHYVIKTDAGDVYTVHFSVNTRIVKAPARRGQGDSGEGANPPQPIKPADIKVGDAVTAGGEVDAAAKSIGAVMIMQLDPERVKQLRERQANFGKTWLMGKVTAMDGVKVTVQGGPGDAAHTFMADENTTFRKRREPITLGDVQVGDMVGVEGAMKDGTFMATSVAVMGQPQGDAGSREPK